MDYRITKEVYASGKSRFIVEGKYNDGWVLERAFDTPNMSYQYLDALIKARTEIHPISSIVIHTVTG